MNPQKTQQVVARDEKWVPSTERVKISSTNIILETTVPQKEETFQVVIDVIKNSTCFKAFTISIDVPEMFMRKFWYTIKKVQDTDSYEFLLANKKCIVNAKVFRTILDICPRVEGVDFTDVPNDDTALTFLVDLCYKGPLNRHTNMFMDQMHQLWRTLAAIINNCLSRKLAKKGSRRENMPYPRFTKIIINYFLKQHKSLTNLNHKHYHIIKDDGIVSKLKFVRTGEDYQDYGLPIPDIPPKKSRGKGSKGKKTVDDSQETVDVSKESVPEPVKKKLGSKRVVKKKFTLSANDNVISDDSNAALELSKSISKTKAEEAEAAKKLHDTHARIVIESAKKKSGDRSSQSVAIQDTLCTLKSTPTTSKSKLKGTGGSYEGTGSIPGVPKESTVVPTTSNEGTGAKPLVLDEDKDITEEKVILEWGDKEDEIDDVEKDDKDGNADDEGDEHVNDTQDANDEDVKTESDKDDIYKYMICMRKDEDDEMKDTKVEVSDKGDEEVTDKAKEGVKKTSEAKDDTKKTKLPPSSSSLSVSLGFGDRILKLSFDSSLVSTVKDSADTNISSLLDIPI
nr:hypothetical protein [Tanacetum cinerariifolium]